MPPTTVLLLTHRSDYFTVDRVAAALARGGAHPVRLDTDDFPTRVRLSLLDEGDGPRYTGVSSGPDGGTEELARRFEGEQVAAVWTRSPWPPELPEDLDPAYRKASLEQSAAALDGFLDGLTGAAWVNPPEANRGAGNKLRQHRLARAAGLALPTTLITNDPGEVRTFFDRHDGRVIAKLLLPLSRSMGRTRDFLATTELSADDLEHLDSLRYAPMIFQERIPKDHELRVMVVDGELFTGAIEVGDTGAQAADWRLASPVEVGWQRGTLPQPTAERLRRLMTSLGLVAGAADFIVPPTGEPVFLEINPLGEWGMLERDLDLPISHALATALLRRAGLLSPNP